MMGIAILASPSGVAQEAATPSRLPVRGKSEPQSLAELLVLPQTDLAHVDIALVNLRCAEGLPGSEKIDAAAILRQLDAWATLVKVETDRHLYRVKDPRYADHYRHSETYFRIELLLQTLQEDLGVRYHPDRLYSPDASDSRDQFIHGAMDKARGGTCASMPVLYIAVGRRLGYPLELVMARGHLFCRWDDGKGERLCPNRESAQLGSSRWRNEGGLGHRTHMGPASLEIARGCRAWISHLGRPRPRVGGERIQVDLGCH
jgi:hypothetical protein